MMMEPITRPRSFPSLSYGTVPNMGQLSLGRILKRIFDILFSLASIVMLLPLFVIIGVLIKYESPGRVFYSGWRMGKGGKPFRIWKFRTMYEAPESYAGPAITGASDKRITPFGHWLRDTKVNELPQFWNVLMGEMSFVGPRPEDVDIADKWPDDAKVEILSVRPGITSPASIVYHDEERLLKGTDFMTTYYQQILPDKMRLDRIYVRHHTFLSDLDIIFWTLAILLPRIASTRIPEGNLFGGPISRFVRFNLSWLVIDFIVALLGIALVGVIWRSAGPLELGLGRAIALAVALAASFGFVNTLMGLNRVVWSRAVPEDMFGIVFSTGVVTIIISVLQVVAQRFNLLPPLPSQLIFTMGLVVLIGVVTTRYRWRLLTGLASFWLSRRNSFSVGERVLILGTGDESQFATWLLRRDLFLHAFTIIGIVDDNPYKQGMRFDGAWVIGTSADLSTLVEQHDVGLIMFAVSGLNSEEYARVMKSCANLNVRILLISDMLRALHFWLTNSDRVEDKIKFVIE
ncbi:MAG: sugar transferase [Anaerolineales bacterium]|nr:sugar transferase [Anaerolineales bacterium]